jgi:AcrR family transcriptional regulator
MSEPVNPLLCTLPPGRHRLPREFVEENQRTRLLLGIALTLEAVGYQGSTVGDIVRTAKVSRRTFYDHFKSKEDAAHAVVAEGFAALVASFEGADTSETDGAQEVIENFADAHPAVAHSLFVEGIIAAPRLYELGIGRIAEVSSQPEAAIAAIAWTVRRRLTKDVAA